MQRHIEQPRNGTFARAMLKVGDRAGRPVEERQRYDGGRGNAPEKGSGHRDLLSWRLVSLLQP